jgi:hypothetical protein
MSLLRSRSILSRTSIGLLFIRRSLQEEDYMVKPGYPGGAPAILVIGGLIIVLSLVFAGIHHSKGAVDPVPVHQK